MMKKTLAQAPVSFFRDFKDHPASVGETYIQHMWFASAFAGKLLCAGIAALIHAFIPSMFKTTTSSLICDMHIKMQKRKA